MASLEAKLAEQQKVIEFLTSRYEKDTGRKLPLPTTLGHLLGDPSILGTANEVDEEEEKKADQSNQNQVMVAKNVTFMEHIENLKLPKLPAADANTRKGGNNKKIPIKLPLEMNSLTKISVSGFMGQRLSRAGFKELAEGLELLPSIRSVDFSNNGITDDFQAEILAFFDMPKIKAINLSRNYMKKLGMEIGKTLRDKVNHI